MGNHATTEDLEAGPTPQPELWWSFARKICFIFVIQILLTIAVSATVVLHDPIVTFLTTTNGGLACYIMLIVTPFIMLCPLCYYRNFRRVKYVLFGIFTVSLSSGIGLTCAFTNGKVIFEVTVLTTIIIGSLTLFTLWAVKRGYDFSFLGPFLFGAIMMLVMFAVIQMFFPVDGISILMYGCLPATIFDQLERFGSKISIELAPNLILKSNDQFSFSYNMTNLKKSISEIHLKIKADEKDHGKEGKTRKPQNKTKGISKGKGNRA